MRKSEEIKPSAAGGLSRSFDSSLLPLESYPFMHQSPRVFHRQHKETDSEDNLPGGSDWTVMKTGSNVPGISSSSPKQMKKAHVIAGYSSEENDSDDGFQWSSGISASKSKPVSSFKSLAVDNNAAHGKATSVSQSSTLTVPKGKVVGKKSALPAIPYVNLEQASSISSELNGLWHGGSGPDRAAAVSRLLRTSFKDSVNPYSLGLYLCAHSFDFFLSKSTSLAFTVLLELKTWLVEHGLDELERQFLSPSLQSVAYQVTTCQKNSALLRFVVTIFRLDLIRDQLVNNIRELAASGNYKEACICATILRLYKSFTIHDFIIPLILQERMSIVEEFMIGSEELQKSVLTYLDGLLAKENISAFLRTYVAECNISQVNKTRFESKPMSKLIQKLSEKFKIDPSICPNSSRRKRAGSLRHILSRKYGDSTGGGMNDAAFEDLLDDIVLDDPTLQDEAVFLLRIYGDLTAAAQFALRKTMDLKNIPDDVLQEMRRLNPNVFPKAEEKAMVIEEEDWDAVSVIPVPPKSLAVSPKPTKKSVKLDKFSVIREEVREAPSVTPSDVAMKMGGSSPGSPGRLQKRSRASQNYYTLQLPSSRIYLVENIQGVNLFLKHLRLGQANMEKSAKGELFTVGFDAEWKPINAVHEGVSIIQVASPEDIFLIDCVKLKELERDVEMSAWKSLLLDFFANEKIVKLAYGISEDLKKLAATTPYWKNMPDQFKGVIDLQPVSKELQKMSARFFPHHTNKPKEFKGLAELVRLCTGTPLNKDEQWSNWEKRPLRETQVLYAATDAYCLLELFDFMKVRCREKHVDFQRLIQNHANVSAPGPSSPEGKKGKRRVSADLVKNVTNLARGLDNNSPFKTVQPAHVVRVVVDNMFGTLGKQLRACGIDTIILEDKETHTKCALYALKDERYIITQGPLYGQLSSYVPPGHCFQVKSDSIMSQLRDVLVYFNIAVNDVNMFTRCQLCNSKTFVNVSSESMKSIILQCGSRSSGYFDSEAYDGAMLLSAGVHEDMIPANLTAEKWAQRTWELLPESVFRYPDPTTVKTKKGASVELPKIPLNLLNCIDNFYVCNECGKCYWEGARLERILAESKGLEVMSTESIPL